MKEAAAATIYNAAHELRLVADSLAQRADELQSDLEPREVEQVSLMVDACCDRMSALERRMLRETGRMLGAQQQRLSDEA